MGKIRGTVKWFNESKGYGFIGSDATEDVFVHYSEIIGEVNQLRTLHDGQIVEYEIRDGEKGPQAINVRVINNEDEGNPSDSDYYGIGFFEGRIRLISLSKDGNYQFVDETEKYHNILYSVSASSIILKNVINEFEYLINSPVTTENDLQDFFERNPKLILNDEYKKAHAHITLTKETSSLIPDFLLEPVDQSSLCDILDLKHPSAKIFVLKENRMRFSAAVLEACAQLREYSCYFDEKENRERIFREYGLLAYRPKMIVIIGRRGDIDPINYRKMQSDVPNLILRTYDDILARAKRRLDPS